METYNGHVRTPNDAIILFEACRLGNLPRVQRRLSEKERHSIKAGSVFVWDEREAGMRRWTDGKSWSASRVQGSFLTYREMEGKRGGSSTGYGSNLARAGRTPESNKSDPDIDSAGDDGPEGYRYKPDGLMKQSFSITTSTGCHLHLISYYTRSGGVQMLPSQDPTLRHIRPPKGMYPEASLNDSSIIPPVTRAPMVTPPMPHGHPGAFQRPNGQMMYASPITYPPPIGYPGFPPTSVPTPPQQYGHQPMAYPPPSSGSPHPVYGAPFQNVKPQTPPSVAQTNGHHRTGSQGQPYVTNYPSQTNTLPRINQTPTSNPTDSSLLSKMDPRLLTTSTAPTTQGPTLPGINRGNDHLHSRTPSPPDSRRDLSATPISRDTAITSSSISATSSGATIPSIGTLVNGALEYEAARSRSASRNGSPAAGHRSIPGSGPGFAPVPMGNAPQDIPHSKMRFEGEDARAVSMLNRAFRT